MNKALPILILVNNIFNIEEQNKEYLQRTIPGTEVTVIRHTEVTPEMLKKAEIIFGWPGPEEIQKAENLRWLHLPSAGADGYMSGSIAFPEHVILTTSNGVYGMPIAEHVFAMILSFNHNLQEYAYHKQSRKWKRNIITRDFCDSTLGIIGLGDIGMEVAKRAKAFGAKVLAVKRTLSNPPEYVDRLYLTTELSEVLKQSDYIVLALPDTAKTQGLINEQSFRSMKPNAFLVNIGRGSAVDQNALIRALQEGWISGAGLDVTTPEPLPKDCPLWELPNVILSPHASGLSPTNDKRRFDLFYRNLMHYIQSQQLENVVNFKEGY